MFAGHGVPPAHAPRPEDEAPLLALDFHEARGMVGAAATAVAPKFVDVTLPEGAAIREGVPRGYSAFAYVDCGDARFGPEQTLVNAPALVVFGDGDVIEASAGSDGGRFLGRSASRSAVTDRS